MTVPVSTVLEWLMADNVFCLFLVWLDPCDIVDCSYPVPFYYANFV